MRIQSDRFTSKHGEQGENRQALKKDTEAMKELMKEELKAMKTKGCFSCLK